MSDQPKRPGTRPDTRLVRAGRRDEWLQGMVNVPVSRTSTVLFEDVASMDASYPPKDGRLSYGRNGTPTQWSLAEALTALEPGASGTRLLPSGSAAVAMALLSALEPGDELLMVDNVYQPTRMFCDQWLKRNGIATRYYDPLAGADEVEALLSNSTRAIFMESPGSLTFEVQDVPGICGVARGRGITTLLDNTWATPLFFPALAHGVDLSILACTKYVAGHADVMLGSVTADRNRLGQIVAEPPGCYGQYVSPDDAFLAARGLRTMGVRLRRHEDSAIKIARWLDDQPQVADRASSGIEGLPRPRSSGSATSLVRPGLFSFVLKGADEAAANRFVESLELFGIGYSWGGFESLAIPVHPKRSRTDPPRQTAGHADPPAHRARRPRRSRSPTSSRASSKPVDRPTECPWQVGEARLDAGVAHRQSSTGFPSLRRGFDCPHCPRAASFACIVHRAGAIADAPAFCCRLRWALALAAQPAGRRRCRRRHARGRRKSIPTSPAGPSRSWRRATSGTSPTAAAVR